MQEAKSTFFDKYLIKKTKNHQQPSKSNTKPPSAQNTQKVSSQPQKPYSQIQSNTHPPFISPLKSTALNKPIAHPKYETVQRPRKTSENIEKQENQQTRQQSHPQVCGQLILIGPFDLVNAEEEQLKLEQLLVHCEKKAVIQWIKYKNQGKNCPKDFKNIQKINDQEFWCEDMQRIITLLLKDQKQYNGCIAMLSQFHMTQQIQLTRKQIFLLISGMFLSIIPAQMNNLLVSFAELMAVRPVDEKYKHKPPVRLQKLKCVINYLKYMLNNEQIFNQILTFQRVYSHHPCSPKDNTPLSAVQIQCGKIQSGYGQGVIIDFANSNVGGGFLTNGSAQQQILFSIFPQMIVIKLLCQSLRDKQAIIVHGARRINDYEGYSHQFKFKGTYYDHHMPYQSCIVAVDALDYTQGIMNKSMQYGQKFIKRELNKIFLGIQAAKILLKQGEVYTGRWGCGVFGADQYLKFCIQWIACSEAGSSMRFFTDDSNKVKQLNLLVENIKHLAASDLLYVIQNYGKKTGCNEKGFLQYLKQSI